MHDALESKGLKGYYKVWYARQVDAAKKALAESETQRDSLALKVAQAAGAIHAAEELKELR